MRCMIILALVSGALSGPVEDSALREFTAGNHKFTAAVYKELVKTNKDNIVFSPFSAETILALTNEGAKGETEAEFVRGLSLPSSKEKTQEAFQNLLPKLKTNASSLDLSLDRSETDEDLKLLSANKIYAGLNVTLKDDFKSIATNIYDSSVENVDFTQKFQTAQAINKWVEDNTNQKIKNLITPESLTNNTRLILVNTLYFKGKWEYWFEDYLTETRKFWNNKNESVEVPTMCQADYLNYYENPKLNARFLELPYEGDDIKMVIVLPNSLNGLERLEQNIDEVFEPQPYFNQKLEVFLPKFAIETQTDFIPILQNLGISKAFTNEADLTGISSTDKELYIDRIVQKTFIDVNEAGTEAASATEVKHLELSLDETKPLPFIVNHPFLFYVVYNNIVLFSGRILKL